jgi:DNA invertase Pin-like site-specific DNA recombinase
LIMKVAIYTRVSTDGQSVNAQLADLRETAARRGWEVVHEYTDKGISGAKGRDQRPGLDAMLKAATRGDFDMVAAWSVDRLGRSLQHLVAGMSDLQASSVGLYLHKQGLDTSTPSGRAMFGMLSVFAEFERDLIKERVRAGMKVAQAEQAAGKERLHMNGRLKMPIGRPPVSTATEDKVRALRAKDWGVNRIARELGIGSGTVRRIAYAGEAVT